MDNRKFPTDWSYPFKAVDLLAFDGLTEADYKGINFTEQINNTAAEIDNLTSDVFYTDKWTNLTTDPKEADFVKRQLVFKAFQFLFKYNVNFQQKWLGKGNISASLGDASVARQFDQERPPSINLFVTNLLNKAGFYTPMTAIEVRGNQPSDDIYGANGAMRYLPIGGSPPKSNSTVDRKWVEDNFLRPNSISQIHGTNTLQINDNYDPPKVELAVKNSGKTVNIVGAEGITVTEPDRTTWKISGKTLQDRVTGHGRDIATNRALANANTQHLLELIPGDKKVTQIKAGNNVTLDYTPEPGDNTKGLITVNASGGGSGGITNITGSNGIAVTGSGDSRDISGKAINDRIPPDIRLWAASSDPNNRLVTNNIHALEFYLGATNHHDKGVIMWEGNAVDVPNRNTKEVARFTHNDSTGECWLRMGVPGKYNFRYYQPDWNSDGTLTLGYGAKAGSITSSQLKALVNLKPLEMGNSGQHFVARITSGDNVTFGYDPLIKNVTVNAGAVKVDDGGQQKTVTKIVAGTNVSFAINNGVVTINATAGQMTDAEWVAKFKKLVSSTNLDVLRVTNIGGGRIQLHPEFSKNQLWSSRSTTAKSVFRDVSEFEISTAGRTDKEQYFIFKRKDSNQYFKLGFFQAGQNWKAGYEFQHMEHMFPGKGHPYGKISAYAVDNHTSGLHTAYISIAERQMRGGTENEKTWTPTGVKSTYDAKAKIAKLEAKIAKLERWLKIKL